MGAEDREDVAEHGRRRLGAARAGADQHDLAGRGRLDQHGVVGPADGREPVAAGHQGRVDARAHRAVDQAGDAEQLHHEAQRRGVLHVLGLEAVDALVGHVFEEHARVEGDRREDRHLGRRVGAADVLGRVGLGVAEIVGPAERRVVGETAAGHLGEDEVRRAVDDAGDCGDLGGQQRLAQHLDHRDRGARRRLEAQLGAGGLGGGEQLRPVAGEQLLVGRHDRGAAGEGGAQIAERGVEPAHHLDHDRHGRVLEHPGGVGRDETGIDPRAYPRRVAHQHRSELEPLPGGARDRLPALAQQPNDGLADGAAAEQPDADGGPVGWRRRAHRSRATRSW